MPVTVTGSCHGSESESPVPQRSSSESSLDPCKCIPFHHIYVNVNAFHSIIFVRVLAAYTLFAGEPVAAEPVFPRPRPRRRAENLPSAGPTPSVALRRARTNAGSGAPAPGRHCSPPGGAGGGGRCVCIHTSVAAWRSDACTHTDSSSRVETRAREQSHKRKCAHTRKS
jgi:hypothetical protein